MMIAHRVEPDPSLQPRVLDRMVFEQGFPVYSEDATVFAYRGDVDEVRLLHFGWGLPDDLKFERLGDSTWWLLALDLPEGTRLEYKLLISEGGRQYDIEDPLNPFEARNPFGQNSVCRSFGYSVPPWALRDPEASVGLQRSLTIPSTHLDRLVHVTAYLPHEFSMEPEHKYPLLIMHDGTDYLHYADAATVLDNLIHRGLTPEFVVVFCDPGERLVEYADHEAHARFIAEELVPYLEAHLPLIGDREHRCLGGASLGAVATLSTARRFPDVFGRLLLQSGSFHGAAADGVVRNGEVWATISDFVTDFTSSPSKTADRMFMSCGILEPLIRENRALRPVLADSGSEVLLSESLDGHTWGCWRDNLGIGLSWLFADSFRRRDVRPFARPERPDATGSEKGDADA